MEISSGVGNCRMDEGGESWATSRRSKGVMGLPWVRSGGWPCMYGQDGLRISGWDGMPCCCPKSLRINLLQPSFLIFETVEAVVISPVKRQHSGRLSCHLPSSVRFDTMSPIGVHCSTDPMEVFWACALGHPDLPVAAQRAIFCAIL